MEEIKGTITTEATINGEVATERAIEGRLDVAGIGGGGNVDDVQINGTSIVVDKVANIPIASEGVYGVTTVTGEEVAQIKEDLTELPTDLGYIKIGGGNLLTTTFEGKAISTATGAITDNVAFWISDIVDVNDAPTIYSTDRIYKVAFYDENQVFKEAINVTNVDLPEPGTVLNNRNLYRFIRFQYHINDVPYADWQSVVVNTGSEKYTNEKIEKSYSYIYPQKGSKEYDGEMIIIDNHKHSFELKNKFTLINSPQGGAIYNGKLFQLNSNALCDVYNLESGNRIHSFYLDNYATITPHSNAVFFGAKYNASDVYPILFCNAYNNTDLPLATLYAYRIIENNGVFTSTLLGSIKLDFTSDSIWTDGYDARPYGNFVLDTFNNILYAYTMRDNDKVLRFFGFKMPSINGDITLAKSKIITMFDVPYVGIIQDSCYCNGMVFIVGGYGNSEYPSICQVVDIVGQFQRNRFTLIDGAEPEMIDVYNGKMYTALGTTVYEIIFN